MLAIGTIAVGTIVVGAPGGAPLARAESGDCAKKTNVEERLVCIEKKADGIQPAVAAALQGVKIEQASRPSICLFFKDHDQPAYAIADCSHTAEQTFNIHK